MIGMLIVAHGGLAREFAATLEHIVGPQESLCSIGIYPDDDMDSRREEILRAVNTVDTGKGVVVLTDLFGGTPSNLAIAMLEQNRVEVIAGVNLPLLVRLAKLRDSESLADAVAKARDGGRKYITVASDLLSGAE